MCRIVADGPKQGSLQILPMFRDLRIVLIQPLGVGTGRHIAHFIALALNVKEQYALSPDAVKEQGGQNGTVAEAFDRVFRRGFQQLAWLRITEHRRRPFVVVSLWPLHTLHRIQKHGDFLTEILIP